jgi:hypothetical protein
MHVSKDLFVFPSDTDTARAMNSAVPDGFPIEFYPVSELLGNN